MDLRTVLVDDEQLARDELGYLLGQVGGVEVIGQAGNGVEALATIERLHPDLVFLDVQMPGLTGFEVARRMLDGGPISQIIFVTAYDQHAIEAFEVNAVDYLLKPVDQARLEVALQRARRRISFDRHLDRENGGPSVSADQLEKIVQIVTERRRYEARLRAIFREGCEHGELRTDLDENAAALLMLSAANWAYTWLKPGRDTDALADSFAAILIDGIRGYATPT